MHKIVCYTLQLWLSYLLSFTCWYTSASSSLPSSPLREPHAKMKPRDDFSLNQLWLPTIIQPANNEPSLWEQSKSNVCSADKVSNQNSLPAQQLCQRDKEDEKIMRRQFAANPARCGDHLEVREFIHSFILHAGIVSAPAITHY